MKAKFIKPTGFDAVSVVCVETCILVRLHGRFYMLKNPENPSPIAEVVEIELPDRVTVEDIFSKIDKLTYDRQTV